VAHGSFGLYGCMQGSHVNLVEREMNEPMAWRQASFMAWEGTGIKREGKTSQVFGIACNEWVRHDAGVRR
jgi:hypothetical protein